MSAETTTIRGIGVGRGAAVAPVVQVAAVPVAPADEAAASSDDQLRVHEELRAVGADLHARATAASGVMADTLGAAAEIAQDPALLDAIDAELAAGAGPATAVDRATEQFAAVFREAGGMLAERVSDLMSVRHRLVARLLGVPTPGIPELTTAAIVVAHDLSPADTASADLEKVAGIITEVGGPTSHTAIIAGQLGVPCVVGADGATGLADGSLALVDAAVGTVVPQPSSEAVAAVEQRQRTWAELSQDESDGATVDGHPVQLLANIGSAQDAREAAMVGIEGAGLFRTEVLFLDRAAAPSMEEQERLYREVFTALPGQKVVTRTLDAGADKPLAFLSTQDEANPALGVRGYRTARNHPELLKAQLTALARAAAVSDADSWVMAPMVSTPEEARDFAALAHGAGNQIVGAMVEVPSAALLAEQLLHHLDFISIGTNDLTQYTMGADRLSTELVDLTDRWQPAVLRLIRIVAEAATTAEKPVGVCGESAADPLMALVLAGLGVTSLSMSAPAVPAVRYALARHSLAQCQHMAQEALAAGSAVVGRQAVRALVAPECVDLLRL